jgi:hypothetical protein
MKKGAGLHDLGSDNDRSDEETSKNMNIMETQGTSLGIFGAPLERQDGLWDWVNDLDTDQERSRSKLNRTMALHRLTGTNQTNPR